MAEQKNLAAPISLGVIAVRTVYSAVLYTLLPLVFLKLAWRARRAPAYWRGWSERLGFFPRHHDNATGVIWIHAVSVGEVQAAVPVLNALRVRYGTARFIATCTTPTGKSHAAQALGAAAQIGYVPYDLPGAVCRFLRRTRPHVAIFMETELWPNLFHACASRGIPVVIANARLSARSAASYQRFRWLTATLWPSVAQVAAQTEADAERFRRLGMPADRVSVTGTVKFDLSVSDELIARGGALRRRWGASRPVWIAASTHAGEDEVVLAAHQRVRENVPGSVLILVPRHPERFDEVVRLSQNAGYRTARRTADDVDAQTEVYVGDTMGELLLYFAAADVAFVGGSLVAVGGHNALEPASLAIPVVTGPYTFNFETVTDLLKQVGALCQASDEAQLAAVVSDWLSNTSTRIKAGSAGAVAVAAHRGATQRLINIIAGCFS